MKKANERENVFQSMSKFALRKRAQSFSLCGQRGATNSYCAIEAIILIALAQCLDWLAVVFHSLKRDARVVTTWHPFRVLFSPRRATHSVEKLFLHRRNVRLLLSMRRLCSGTNELILGFHNRSCRLFRANKRKIFLDAKLKCLKMENLVLWVLLNESRIPRKRLRKDESFVDRRSLYPFKIVSGNQIQRFLRLFLKTCFAFRVQKI